MWQIRDRLNPHDRCLVMGILNVTPDSFSDGGNYFSTEKAVQHGVALVNQGADLLDIGAESTRPGAAPVLMEEELRRIVPVVEALADLVSVPLSIDTWKPNVARHCLEAGAHIINDVTAMGRNFAGDDHALHEEMLEVIAELKPGVILMHMQGSPSTMQVRPAYNNPVEDILAFFQSRIQAVVSRGVSFDSIAIDPGIGFGKKDEHNLALLRELHRFQALDRPVCLGVSRKGLVGRILQREVHERDAGSLAIACYALERSAVQIIRAHDVAGTADAVRVHHALGRSN